MNWPVVRPRYICLQGIGLIIVLVAGGNSASAAPSPVGQWTVANGQASIRVVDCGGRYWGFVASEQKPGGTDKNNPNPAMRRRPTLGMPILLGLTPGNQPATWSGQIYNSQDGRTYSGQIRLTGHDTLHVEGCVLGFLCGGEDWRRASAGPATTGSAVADEPAAKVCSSLAR